MSRLDATPDHRLLVRVLTEPSRLSAVGAPAIGRLLDAAHEARLLGWLVAELDRQGVPAAPPEWLRDRLITVHALVREYDRSLDWEVDRLHRAFLGTGIPWVLLKGAAYRAASLAPGRGRRVADIDVLVHEERLMEAERALEAQGWAQAELDPYDERFYREWMHELPPMVHADRQSIVDLHHAILPRTSRLSPPTPRLIAQSIEVAPGIRTLCPEHMVLHAAAHLFHDGEIAGAIRDLVDLDLLLRDFGRQPGFWERFAGEAQALGLERPAYYAVRYARRLFGTPVSDVWIRRSAGWAPSQPLASLMDWFVARAVQGSASSTASFAAFCLYVRSHWLRMPPLLLVRHLLRKAFRRA